MTETLSFYDTVRARHSVRQFLPTPLADAVIASVLADAQLAPSNCNSQPWCVHIVSGAKLRQLSEAIIAAAAEQRFTPDFGFAGDAFYGVYAERRDEQAAAYYDSLGIARDDPAGRTQGLLNNFRCYGAPHLALLFFPSFGAGDDHVRVASDVGMYAQTFLLALAARGLGGVPQTAIGMFAATIREVLGVPDQMKLLFAISFGHSDPAAPANRFRLERAPLAESVVFHR